MMNLKPYPNPNLLMVGSMDLEARKALLSEESRSRRISIIDNTIGGCRMFNGNIWIGQEQREDAEYLEDIQQAYDNGIALAYWTDGSCQQAIGALGAGVAWEENNLGKRRWTGKEIPLGQDTGSSMDAELYAIKASLELAIGRAQEDPWIRHVRILSDCMVVLEGLQSGKICNLGPAVSSTWALQSVYDLTDYLISGLVSVDLVWVKAHAGSAGNEHADKLAKRAAWSQNVVRRVGLKRRGQVPSFIKEMGMWSEDEWLYRANKRWLDRGGEEEDEWLYRANEWLDQGWEEDNEGDDDIPPSPPWDVNFIPPPPPGPAPYQPPPPTTPYPF
ncbi:reverse transcriptase [Pyrenophora seminiperda CCB06]|uniref:Reverse transcriptase n=1 Tax=Pyrenophora seminiperda CCB06 TaxID=1302712 RepID=A0A3M7M272_9PLEO|nr:reverse transcriptase [Pyrenophora seminiperda CCB06]